MNICASKCCLASPIAHRSHSVAFPPFVRPFASHEHGHDDNKPHPIDDPDIPRQPDMYRPGSDSFAYENPWPMLNKGRLDWLFNDGWRRPLAADQGAHMRRQWIYFKCIPRDEHKDWKKWHGTMPIFGTGCLVLLTFVWQYCNSDWPSAKEWALREAHFELVRRERAGLPLISQDLIERSRVEAVLPAEEELRDFEILI
ncbi:hypothetical protein niasHS_014072 [Heterodera schachtii]|uniref:NADH dehydrogenase [ubiquinone] 1 beta subcomplex subunit 11, mitochondrial n=1 Tax=Heterodera schachtii TaxID=97005 RepID=A0ABD2IPP1_HETSC